jgi:hypothetical protein
MSLYPENPAGQVFVSQDTYASAGVALTNLGGGGGGGSISANGATVACDAPPGSGNVGIAGSATGVGSQGDIVLITGNVSSGNILVNAINSGGNIELGVGVTAGGVEGSIVLDATNGTGDGGLLFATPSTFALFEGTQNGIQGLTGNLGQITLGSSDTTNPALVSIGGAAISTGLYVSNTQLLFNNAAVGAGGAVPANLTVSTLTAYDSITVGSGYDASLTLNTDTNFASASYRMLFKAQGEDTVGTGILSINKQAFLDLNGSTIRGLAVTAFSTVLGAVQPVACAGLYLGDSTNDLTTNGTAGVFYNESISTLNLQAPNVALNFSSLVGISSINGINWASISTLVG